MESKQDIILNKAKKIKLIISDVDGVLNKGDLFFNKNGIEPFGQFNIYDGFAVIIAHECGLKTAVISGRHSLCTEARCKLLGMEEIHTGILHKKLKLEEIVKRLNLNYDEVAYIGDDLIDLPAIKLVGLSIAPITAVRIVKEYVDFITEAKCGEGVLREAVELILNAQDKYDAYVNQYLE